MHVREKELPILLYCEIDTLRKEIHGLINMSSIYLLRNRCAVNPYGENIIKWLQLQRIYGEKNSLLKMG